MSKPDVIDSFQGDYRFLSNMFPLDFWIVTKDAIAVPSAEHKYMAERFTSRAIREQIANHRATLEQKDKYGLCANGIAAKALARKLMAAGQEFTDNSDNKLTIMEDTVRAKFVINPHLAQRLVSTKDAQLIEGNDWGDTFWGVCDGEGNNHLGEILMKVRGELKETT